MKAVERGRSRAPHPAISAAVAVSAAAVIAFSTAPALAAPYGPEFGTNRYQTEIRAVSGLPDTDVFVSPLVAGERLSVSVTADRRSALHPSLELLDPTGAVRDVTPAVRKGGQSVRFKRFTVDVSGAWTVRIAGVDDTEGAYTVAFKVQSARPFKVKGQSLGGAHPEERSHAFQGIDGGLLDLSVRWRKGDAAVGVRALRDPSGGDVPGRDGPAAAEATTRRTRAQLAAVALADGDGEYGVTVGVDGGTARYSLTARVSAGDRPRGKRVVKLSPDEPFLAARSDPLRGIGGRDVRLVGGNFSVDPPPTVLFDDLPAAVLSVEPGGLAILVTAPAHGEGMSVEVVVRNPDGQAAVAPDHFEYALPPVITGLLHPDGRTAVGGATTGGQPFRVVGEHLHPEQSVRFGSAGASRDLAANVLGELRVLSPPGTVGSVSVFVDDPYGRSSESSFRFEFKPAPAFDAAPYDPPFGAIADAVAVTVTGARFEATDVLFFDDAPVAFQLVDAGTLRFTPPVATLGDHPVRIRDRVGTDVTAPVFAFKAEPSISGVAAVGGSRSGATGVPLLGGAVVEVTGSSFHALDVVRVDGTEVTVTERAFDRFRFTSPAGGPGALDVTVTDVVGQSVTVVGALARLGYADATAARTPAPSAVDDLSAWRGALGDLDVDGRADDLVLVSYGYYRDNVYRGNRTPAGGVANSPGTRAEYTRILFANASGYLVDRTAAHFPAQGSDASGGDDWNAMAVALGDLDATTGDDIVIGGVSPDYTTQNDVRIFRNNGAGTFTLNAADALPAGYLPPLYAYDETGAAHSVFSAVYPQGLPTSLALGDVDRDGDIDIVAGRDMYDQTYAYVDPAYVDFTQSPPYVYSGDANTYFAYAFYYYSATKVFLNPGSAGGSWADGTVQRMPSAGDSNAAIVPAFHSRDVALGDIDGDLYPDLVVAWDDPLTVSAYGLYARGSDPARVATRVLVNDGTGTFVDRTSTWLPPGVSPEFWQAGRVALDDLDNDGRPDLVLLHGVSVDAFLGSPTTGRSALRILRNAGTSFVDVTATAVPALPTDTDENWRGGALLVQDVDGDGWKDLLIATRSAPSTTGGTRLRATRVLLGSRGLVFRSAPDFLPAYVADSGEADDLIIGDLRGTGVSPSLLRLGESAPTNAAGRARLRAADWVR